MGRRLSPEAWAALQSFRAERQLHQIQFEEIQAQTRVDEGPSSMISMDAFAEDWNASQFWVGFSHHGLLRHLPSHPGVSMMT